MSLNLKKLTIKDFKNINNFEIDFDSINIISGENGSGKTSILEALRLLLIGNLNEKLSEYIQRGKNSFNLELDFQYNNEDYTYKYFYNGTSSNRELFSNNDFYKKGDDVKDTIKQFINSDIALYSNISEQGESYSILKQSPSRRLETFKKIIGVEKLQNIIEEIGEKNKNKKTELQLQERELSILKNKKFTYMEDNIELEDIENLNLQLKEEEKQKEINNQNEKLLEKYLNDKKQYDFDSLKKYEIELKLKNKQSDLGRLNKDFSQTEYDSLFLKKQTQDLEQLKYDVNLKEYNAYLKLKEKIEDLKLKKDSIRLNRVRQLDFEQHDVDKLIEEFENIILNIKEKRNHLGISKDGKCPTCGQVFNISFNDLEEELKLLELKKIELMSSIKERQILLKDQEEKVNQNKLKKEQIEFYDKEINSIKIIEIECPNQLPIDLEIDKKIKELKVVKENIEKLKQEILILNTQFESINCIEPVRPVLQDCHYSKEIYEELKGKILIHDQKVNEKKRIEKYNDDLKLEENKNKDEIKKIEININKLSEEISILNDSKEILSKKFSGYLINKSINFIENKMNEFFQKSYPKYQVYFKPTQNQKSIDFYYSNIDENNNLSPASLCSGFEKQILSMSFRVALSYMSGISFMLLDEVDSDASESNSLLFYRNLIESELFNQMLIITHKNDTKNFLVNEFNANLISL